MQTVYVFDKSSFFFNSKMYVTLWVLRIQREYLAPFNAVIFANVCGCVLSFKPENLHSSAIGVLTEQSEF